MIISPIETSDPLALRLTSAGKKYPPAKSLAKHSEAGLQEYWALKGVSLEMGKGSILGVIGRNGSGKSTLLNIISGVLSLTQGSVETFGRVLGLYNLGAGFQDALSGRENIFLNGSIMGASRRELEGKLSAIIDFSELGDFIDMPLGSYSQGMRLRLGFSIVANLDFDILVIDEVLAVGDILFQYKCFEKLLDLKRKGKSLVISSQSLDLIERLADKVLLLEHGNPFFYGDVPEGISSYKQLLNSAKFFVGPGENINPLIEDTKKWAEDALKWGLKLGTKEVVIEKVELINKFGLKCSSIRSKDPLKVRVYFNARDKVKDPHFGVAIFREDGVYCYGPNTAFDGYSIKELKPGKGRFFLNFSKLLLAPGDYRISVAIWDKRETIAFDYHPGLYKLVLTGDRNSQSELTKIPFVLNWNRCMIPGPSLDLDSLKDVEGEVKISGIRILNRLNQVKDKFLTNEWVRISVELAGLPSGGSCYYLWLGIYRDDGIYCQGMTQKIGKHSNYQVNFPKLPLLPGGYCLSAGIWDASENKFLTCHRCICQFNMVFVRQDHGTVYLEHKWHWRNK